MLNPITKEDLRWYNEALAENKVIDLNQVRYDQNEVVQNLFREMLKMHRRQMKPHIRKRTQNPAQGTRWLYPFAWESRYRRYLFDLMNVYSDIAMPAVRENIDRWIREIKEDSIKTDNFNNEFQRMITELEKTQSDMFNENGEGVQGKNNFFQRATIIASLTALGFSISDFNKKQQDKFTKHVLGIPFNPGEPWLDDVINAWATENFTLIKSLTSEYIKKVNTIVRNGIVAGRPSDEIARNIMSDLKKMNKNMTKSRTTLIARDQVGKLNGQLTKRRNQEMGVEIYKWLTAQDERVRASHKALSNKFARWDDDTVYADTLEDAKAENWKQRSSLTATTISKTGAKTTQSAYIGIPGQDIQCRCTSGTQFNEMIQEIDEEITLEQAA